MSAPNDLILYHYPMSPPSRAIVWYLTLLGVKYAECIQPNMLPRPDLEALGVKYRRIPLMSVGRDFYCDSRLMFRKLTELFPAEHLLPQTPEQRALVRLLEKWAQSSLFGLASSLIPVEYFAMSDPAFRKDREEMTGGNFDMKKWPKQYPEGRVNMREAFELLETTILSDGRRFLLNTKGPTLADIQVIYPFDWVGTDPDMGTSLPPDYISDKQFPKVFAWIKRFKAAIKQAGAKAPKPIVFNGKQALNSISESRIDDLDVFVDEHDPLALQAGTEVDIFPVETGYNHKDRGQIVTLTPEEVAVKTRTRDENQEIVIHMPRTGFRVKACPQKL